MKKNENPTCTNMERSLRYNVRVFFKVWEKIVIYMIPLMLKHIPHTFTHKNTV